MKSTAPKPKTFRIEDTSSDAMVNYINRKDEALVDQDDWRNMIFIPFHKRWETVLIVTIIMQCLCVMYHFVFNTKEDTIFTFFWLMLRLFDIFYLLDTIFIIMHRNMPIHRSLRIYPCKNLFLIALDVLTILPLLDMYKLVLSTSYNSTVNPKYRFLLGSTIIRSYRIFIYFNDLSNSAGFNQIVVILFEHIVIFLLTAQVFACAWYTIGYLQPKNERTWKYHLFDHKLDEKSSSDWQILCFAIVGHFLAQNISDSVLPETLIEHGLVIWLLVLGYFMNVNLLFAQLTSVYLKRLKKEIIFMSTLKQIKDLFKDLSVPQVLQNETMKYYKVLWEVRKGFSEVPPVFYELPLALQKEVNTDLFWEAFRHSHMFRDENICFKRSLSTKMKSEFLLAGEYIYTINEPKVKMVYIVSGIVEILSEEDDESTCLTLSAGSIFGEVPCILGGNSLVNVKCKTYCEFFTLSMVDFYRDIIVFTGSKKPFYDKAMERIQFAKRMVKLRQEELEIKKMYAIQVIEESNIKWLKKRWRMLHHYEKKIKIEQPEDSIFHVDITHCSDFLDMLVLSHETEIKMKSIFLTSRWPFIWEPNSSFLIFWNYLVMFIVLIISCVLPFYIVFERKLDMTTKQLLIVADMCFITDFYIKCTTAVREKNIFITKWRDIIVYRATQIYYIMDFLSVANINYIAAIFVESKHVFVFLTINRLFKVHCFFQYFSKYDKKVRFHSNYLNYVRIFFVIFLCTYWFSCIMYAVACFTEPCREDGWYAYGMTLNKKYKRDGMHGRLKYPKFTQSLYTTLQIFFLISADFAYPYAIPDIICFFMITIAGLLLYLICSSKICAQHLLIVEKRRQYMYKIKRIIKNHTFQKYLSPQTKKEVLRFVNFQKRYYMDDRVHSERQILQQASKKLQNEIIDDRIVNILKNILFFQTFEDILLHRIAKVSFIRTIPKKSLILNADDISSWLYVIIRGKCMAKSTMKGDKQRGATILFGVGSVFPLIEVLQNISIFLEVRTLTAVEVLCIPYTDFMLVLKSEPAMFNMMRDTLEAHMKMDEIVLMRQEGRMPTQFAAEQSLGTGDLFKYKIFDDEIEKEAIAKKQVQIDNIRIIQNAGTWGCISYILLKSTINPTGTFFFVWETIHTIHVMLHMFFAMFYTMLINRISISVRKWTMRCLYAFSFADMYVRLHLQYYNTDGILVTHSMFTARNYFNTSFIIDLLSSIPYVDFGMHKIASYDMQVMCSIIFETIAKMLKMYRLRAYAQYIGTRLPQKAFFIIEYLKSACLYSFIVISLANVTILYSCRPSNDDNDVTYLKCSAGSYMNSSKGIHHFHPMYSVIYGLYLVIFSLTRSGFGNLTSTTSAELIWFIILFTIGFPLRLCLLSISVCVVSIKSNALLGYQHKIKSFLKFVSKENVDEELISKTVKYYEHQWNETMGFALRKQFAPFYPHLRQDCNVQIMYPTLLKTHVFEGAGIHFFRQLCPELTKSYIMEDISIIRYNDVQSNVYILHVGSVEITVAKNVVAVLTPGSIFGNFMKEPVIRQTITAKTLENCEVLVCTNASFMSIVGTAPDVHQRFLHEQAFRKEYILALSKTDACDITVEAEHNRSLLRRMWIGINKTYSEKCKILNRYYYITSVYLAPISAISSLMVAFVQYFPLKMWQITTFSIIDAIFFCRIIIGAKRRYFDETTVSVITDKFVIRRHYFLSRWFLLDAISMFPFEHFLLLFKLDNMFTKYFLANRMLRILYMIIYKHNIETSVQRSRHVNWLFLFFIFIYVHTVCVCIWWMTACKDEGCSYLQVGTVIDKTIKAPLGLKSLFICWTYVTNLFTTCGMREVMPQSWEEMLAAVIIIIIGHLVTVYLMSRFTGELITVRRMMSNYEYNIEKLFNYLKDRELSPVILHKVWQYCLEKWHRAGGCWLPTLISTAPSCLKQELMNSMYGKHLENHAIFKHAHINFIKQIVCHLKRTIYLPNDNIVEKGDSDFSLYFIHKGKVEVYDKIGEIDVLTVVLNDGEAFGENAGLFHEPHTSTYKARTICDILTLDKFEWEYLLYFFPASRQIIYESAKTKFSALSLKKTSLYAHTSRNNFFQHDFQKD